MIKQTYQLSQRSIKIIVALRHAFIKEPEGLIVHNSNTELIDRGQKMLGEQPVVFRLAFILGLNFFDCLTLFFGFGFRRFVRLKDEKKTEYVESWMRSRVFLFREFAQSLRSLIVLSYFSHKDIWNYLGYDPVKHAKERISLRQKLMEDK